MNFKLNLLLLALSIVCLVPAVMGPSKLIISAKCSNYISEYDVHILKGQLKKGFGIFCGNEALKNVEIDFLSIAIVIFGLRLLMSLSFLVAFSKCFIFGDLRFMTPALVSLGILIIVLEISGVIIGQVIFPSYMQFILGPEIGVFLFFNLVYGINSILMGIF